MNKILEEIEYQLIFGKLEEKEKEEEEEEKE